MLLRWKSASLCRVGSNRKLLRANSTLEAQLSWHRSDRSPEKEDFQSPFSSSKPDEGPANFLPGLSSSLLVLISLSLSLNPTTGSERQTPDATPFRPIPRVRLGSARFYCFASTRLLDGALKTMKPLRRAASSASRGIVPEECGTLWPGHGQPKGAGGQASGGGPTKVA